MRSRAMLLTSFTVSTRGTDKADEHVAARMASAIRPLTLAGLVAEATHVFMKSIPTGRPR